MGPEELKIWLSNKKVEYEDDADLSKFLSSDKSDGYKYSIIKLLETDYSRFTYGGPKINEVLAMGLKEINFLEFKKTELMALAKNLGLQRYSCMDKDALIRQIELVKKQFQDKPKINQRGYKGGNQVILQRQVYYKENKQYMLKYQRRYRQFNIQNKLYYCDVCDI